MASLFTYSQAGRALGWQPSMGALLTPSVSGTQQRLLATLAKVSQANQGWILLANAPAPLCKQTLQQAGINLARVIDAKQLSQQWISYAKQCAGIAAVVCWKNNAGQLTTETHVKGAHLAGVTLNSSGYGKMTNRCLLPA